MLRFNSFASSSRGNCYALTDESTGEQLMIEAGLAKRKIRAAFDYNFSSVVGVLISHEHADHSRAAGDLARDGLQIYASRGTAEAVGLWNYHTLCPGEIARIGHFTVLPFSVMHDASEPLGFLIRGSDGDKLLFATDTVNIPVRARCGIYALEANFSRELIGDKFPEKVKNRIMHTHMDISKLCEWLRGCDLSECREIHLIHLSTASSDEERFVKAVLKCVPRGVKVSACEV